MPQKPYMHGCVCASTYVHGSSIGTYRSQLILKLILSSLDYILASAEGGLGVSHGGIPRLGFQPSVRIFSVLDL